MNADAIACTLFKFKSMNKKINKKQSKQRSTGCKFLWCSLLRVFESKADITQSEFVSLAISGIFDTSDDQQSIASSIMSQPFTDIYTKSDCQEKP